MRQNLDISRTLFALSSGPLPSAVAIERISGPDAFSIARQLFKPASGQTLERARGMTFGALVDEQGQRIDEVLALGFVGPHSFTGEDVVEFHCHGSVPIIRRLESCLLSLGAVPAEKGEFSYRAHFHGKLSAEDLERLGDVFLARQTADLQRIYSRRDGALTQAVEVLRQHLIRLLAIFDTAVDFVDEYSNVVASAREPLETVTHGCSAIIQRYSRFQDGATAGRIVLAGRPNAGKSSLFNGLLCRYRAIVHADPGTTRDVIEEDVEIDGRTWKLVDTAGVRPALGEAERQGIELGADFLEASSFWLLVVDGTQGMGEEERGLLSRFSHRPHAIVWNKKDLAGWCVPADISSKCAVIAVSALQGESLAGLWEVLQSELKSLGMGDFGPLPSAVQANRLKTVVTKLGVMKEDLDKEVPPEYLSEQARAAIQSLESVVGEVGTEEVLDRIFNDFCIGK